MDISSLLKSHVYTAILLGSLVEGETTVVLAGFAAHQGYAPWWAVTLLAATINFCLDQGYYALGRWRGEWMLLRLPGLRRGVDRVSPLLHRHRRCVTFGVRFMYGLRTAGPLALGIARVPGLDFLIFNALGAVVWAALFAALGDAFGRAVETLIGEIARYEAQTVAVILAGGGAWFLIRRVRPVRAAQHR